MNSAKQFKKQVLTDMDGALLEEGLAHPLSLEDKLRRESYEEGFLEGRLEQLSANWETGKVTQWEFQEKAMVLHAMLQDLDTNPGRFSWLLKRVSKKQEQQTGPRGEA